jgi:catechol 2,3-dioxygenase
MTVKHRSAGPTERCLPPATTKSIIASLSLRCRGSPPTLDRSRHKRLQHVAFEYPRIDDLLGTYVRLKRLGIQPVLAADQGLQTAFYYKDPDHNIVELNVNNYGDEWTATEHMKTSPDFAANPMGAYDDPEKMIAARKTGATPWELHERVHTCEFAPAQPIDPRILL